ncbi:MAG TPA: hypothetical protein VIU61_14070 [Kofleriaceae bacterium]
MIPHWVLLFTLLGCTEPELETELETETVTAEVSTVSYRGWNRYTGACNVDTPLEVHEPAWAGRYPVFLYAVGTGALVSSDEAELAAAEMAKRGFVAAVLQYDTLTGFSCPLMQAKASCAYAGWRTYSAVATLCRRAKADCSRGIVVGGLSQGGSMAVLAANADARIRAAWAMGFGGGAAGTGTQCYVDGQTRLASDRLRVVNGRDGQAQPIANLNAATGTWCSSTNASCLRANGSGWYLVSDAQVEDGNADHCYFVGPNASGGEVGCTTAPARFDVGWAPPSYTPWSLQANLDWLASFAD